MKFIIFHGAFGNPEENWFPYLKKELQNIEQEVLVPKFPVENWDDITEKGPDIPARKQTLNNWFKVFSKLEKSIKSKDKLCFIAHSLSPIFILHALEKLSIQLDSAIFVCPFLRELKKSWQIDHVNSTFYKTNFNFKKLRKLIPISYTLYSDNDPYVDPKYAIEFADKLGSSKIIVKGAGHMNKEAGFVKLPLVYELCRTRLI